MITEVNDMQGLMALTEELINSADELEESLKNMKKIISKASNYDGIDVTTAANILKRNFDYIITDVKNTAKNVENYTRGLNVLNTDDFTTQANIFSLKNIGNGINDFFTSTVPTTINNFADDVGNVAQNIANTISSPITMIVDKINIVQSPPDEETEEEQTNNEMPLYDQTNYPDIRYGSGSVATSGCGITCLAMVASYYTGEEWTPDKCAALGNNVEGHEVTNVERMLTAADKIGLHYEQKTTNDIMSSLQEGKTVIALVNNSGHFVVLRGLTEDGKVLVNDPYGPWQTEKNSEGQALTINENGYISQNDINLTAGRIWVFDGLAQENNSNQSSTI